LELLSGSGVRAQLKSKWLVLAEVLSVHENPKPHSNIETTQKAAAEQLASACCQNCSGAKASKPQRKMGY